MVKKEAVSDTSSILFLAKVNRFDLLKNFFKKIYVTSEVYNELFSKESPENNIIKKEFKKLLKRIAVKKILDISCGKGKRSAISYCIEKKIRFLITDDRRARLFAESLNIKPIGTLGIILISLKKGFIIPDKARKIFKALISGGFYINSNTYSDFIKQIEIIERENGN